MKIVPLSLFSKNDADESIYLKTYNIISAQYKKVALIRYELKNRFRDEPFLRVSVFEQNGAKLWN